MECVEAAALKSNFKKDMALKFSPQTFLEELSGSNAQNVDDFFVDELLDFSHEEEEEEALQQEQQQLHASVSVSPQNDNNNNIEISEIRNPSLNDHFGSLPTSDLSVPVEEAADLEWLSHFVEDSFSEYSTCFPTVASPAEIKEKAPEPVPVQPCFKTPVPCKARSKRTRTGVRVWPLGFGSPSFTDSTSSSSTSSSSSSSPTSTLLTCAGVTQHLVKRAAGHDGGAARRCSHCGVQKTPQWRTGPLGAKTLCNACGVRFKSGRLLPEYRPACSPTFSSELHSNHHRKVLEMRRKKEVVAGGDETGSPPVVPGFD